ncbi:hypothetical protein BgAZ_106300 [Babesia gibsoni]|uniref:Ubiquinol-cytochrome c chaperone domain-containing protein n=1 Tax=Babesia gibsoni TaxID=33632 RepID=A0AAD8PG60_BABGI|nr:hypothetical protein BgAZ_106300 [Babesia gibsoni]
MLNKNALVVTKQVQLHTHNFHRLILGFSTLRRSDKKKWHLNVCVNGVLKRDTDENAMVHSASSNELSFEESPEEYCREILNDPISDVSVEETSRFLIPYPKKDVTYLIDVITRPFRENYVYEPASMMLHLCVERLENEELCSRFHIGPGFNRRLYFLTLHVWILHRRAMKEMPLGLLLDKYLFQFTFQLFKEWLAQRKVPEHRFKKELENCQAFMMKFLVELDQCTLDEDMYPHRISKTMKYHMYEDDVDDETLRLLVKYIIRQFVHISNLDSKHYLDAMFLWADNEAICKPQRLLKRAMPQLVKYGGYKASLAENAARIEKGSEKISS